MTTGLTETNAKYATIGIGTVMVIMTLISIPLMDRSGRRTLHLYGLGGMFIFSIFITISFLVKVSYSCIADSPESWSEKSRSKNTTEGGISLVKVEETLRQKHVSLTELYVIVKQC